MEYNDNGLGSKVEFRSFLIADMPYYVTLGHCWQLLLINDISAVNLAKHSLLGLAHGLYGLPLNHVGNNDVGSFF